IDDVATRPAYRGVLHRATDVVGQIKSSSARASPIRSVEPRKLAEGNRGERALAIPLAGQRRQSDVVADGPIATVCRSDPESGAAANEVRDRHCPGDRVPRVAVASRHLAVPVDHDGDLLPEGGARTGQEVHRGKERAHGQTGY